MFQPYPTAAPLPYKPMTTTPVNSIQPSVPFNWVSGMEMAVNWPVQPGASIILMDTQAPILYIKSVDVTGRVMPIEVYDLIKREPDSGNEPITRSEVEDLLKKYLGDKKQTNHKTYSKKDDKNGEVVE